MKTTPKDMFSKRWYRLYRERLMKDMKAFPGYSDGVSTGRVIHRVTLDYEGGDFCGRFLIIDDRIWMEVDEEGTLGEARMADLYGRVHLEERCPNRRKR